MRLWVKCSSFLVLIILLVSIQLPASAQNLSIRDVPLKSWMGFGRHWDWMYDSLRYLVTSGLAGRVVLNTKPMSRREMALIVGDIVRRIQNNNVPGFETRTDLQNTLLDLMKELSPELRALGLTGPGITGDIPQWFEFKPLEYLQIAGGYASNAPTNIENHNGFRLDKGMNGNLTGSSWLEMGGFLAGYIQPEGEVNQDTIRGRLIEGYSKLRGGPIELVMGKEALWWGPSYHGSMMISNNALPLPMVRLQTAQQVQIPWQPLRDMLGPLKFTWYLATLQDGGPNYLNSKAMGFRLDLVPVPWLELALDRSTVFDGSNRTPYLPWYKYWQVPIHGNKPGTEGNAAAGDNRFQFDADFRFANVQKYLPFTRDAEFYLDVGWDDTCCQSSFIPIYPGYTAGAFFPNLFGSPDTDFRFEYTHTGGIQFVHGEWGPDWNRYGQQMATFIGPGGQDIFVRLQQRFDQKIQVGLEADFARIGSRQSPYDTSVPNETRNYVGVDVVYQYSPALALKLGSRFEFYTNRDHVQGQNGTNQVYMASVTYGFAPLLGGGQRRTVPPGDVPTLDAPEAPPDPDQIVSWTYAGKVLKDGGSILLSPIDWSVKQWLIAGGVLAATGGAMALDTTIHNANLAHPSQTKDNIANVVSNVGLFAPMAGTVVNYILGEVTHDQRAKERAADGAEAGIISMGMVAYPLKFLLGRERPSANQGAFAYHPFYAGGSLPSFHAIDAYTAAAVVAEYWDNPWVSAAAYSFATAVGWARIAQNDHWFSDIVLSAGLGIAIGKTVVKLNQLRREQNLTNVSIIPLPVPGAWGAAVNYRY